MGEGAEDRTEDHLGAEGGDCHADLPLDFFLGSFEDEVSREGLERRSFIWRAPFLLASGQTPSGHLYPLPHGEVRTKVSPSDTEPPVA